LILPYYKAFWCRSCWHAAPLGGTGWISASVPFDHPINIYTPYLRSSIDPARWQYFGRDQMADSSLWTAHILRSDLDAH
jgi:hypothetical protein